jgi:hypothetical protein
MAARLRYQQTKIDGAPTTILVGAAVTDYGPADAASTAVRTIRCGVVGTPQAIDGLRRWLDRCRQPIPGKKSRLGRLFMPFPGFDTSAGFRSTLIFDSRLGA